MSRPAQPREDREAIELITARIHRRDRAAPEDRPAAEAFAAELVALLRAHGWRIAPALRPWQPQGPPASPGTVHQRAAEIRKDLGARPRPAPEDP